MKIIRKKNATAYRKIAAFLCLSLCLQIMAPAEEIFAKYTTPETETHNTASQKLGSYTTSGYVIKDPITGNEVTVPVHKETEVKGDKTLTTNSLDMDWLNANAEKYGVDLDNFIVDGQYEFNAQIQYDVVIDKSGKTESFVGQDLLNAPDMWGGAWSSKTKKNILDEENSICEGTYYYPAPTTPPPTPVPVPTCVCPSLRCAACWSSVTSTRSRMCPICV